MDVDLILFFDVIWDLNAIFWNTNDRCILGDKISPFFLVFFKYYYCFEQQRKDQILGQKIKDREVLKTFGDSIIIYN